MLLNGDGGGFSWVFTLSRFFLHFWFTTVVMISRPAGLLQ